MSFSTTSAATPLAVDVNHLSRSFRGTQALDDVSLQVPVGSIFGLVGLNGAGKTTLIRHLIGSLRAQHGSVAVLGEDPITSPESVLKRVGYMTEEDSLPKWMRVGDLIDFTRAIYPGWDDAYASQMCQTFSLERGAKLRSLSKGQRARAGLLVAIAHRPELLILDEPSSGLDPIARSDILEAVIRTISEDGRTVLFSSHLLEEVDRVCDWVAVMNSGRIMETIPMEQLESHYSELICRPAADWQPPAADAGTFGWRQIGSEWSVVVDSRACRLSETELLSRYSVIERRAITLHRWFAARVGSPAETVGTPQLAEEPTHV